MPWSRTICFCTVRRDTFAFGQQLPAVGVDPLRRDRLERRLGTELWQQRTVRRVAVVADRRGPAGLLMLDVAEPLGHGISERPAAGRFAPGESAATSLVEHFAQSILRGAVGEEPVLGSAAASPLRADPPLQIAAVGGADPSVEDRPSRRSISRLWPVTRRISPAPRSRRSVAKLAPRPPAARPSRPDRVERLGQRFVERFTDERRDDALAERLDLDRLARLRRVEAAVDLRDRWQVALGGLLGGQRDAPPVPVARLVYEYALRVRLNVGPLWIEVADVENGALVAAQDRGDVRVQEAADLPVRRRYRGQVLLREGPFQDAAEGPRLSDDQRRRRAVPAADPGVLDGLGSELGHGVGVVPRGQRARLVNDPLPRHETFVAQPLRGVG